jgi:predicted MFS family arabinose efflux permease
LLVVGGMFSTFFFLTQFLQGVNGFSPLQAGLAFLPMTAVMFTMGRVVPRLIARFGNTAVLLAGLSLAVAGIAWLTRISLGTDYFPQIAIPLALVGTGIGIAFAPLTSAGIAGVAPADAGAASGLLNVAQQLGASLGLGILITVFASASRSASHDPLAGASAPLEQRHELAHAVATALTGSALFLALAIAVVVVLMRPERGPRDAAAPAAAPAAR